LLNGSVQDLHIDPKEVAVIAPYAANVKLINSIRRNYPSLKALADTTTIDSFQGQEISIALVVMGTAHPRPGPEFIQNKQRLNVLYSTEVFCMSLATSTSVTISARSPRSLRSR